jgi:RimJ/RimL family protein N-acetyltransferase
MKKKARRPPRPKKKSAPKKPFTPSTEPRATDADVTLEEGTGGPRTGGEPGGRFWHVRFHGKTAGRAYINYHVSESGKPRPSVTVLLNKQSQGRGIGTIAFRKAAEESQYDEVYATVAKKNIASTNALARAGFVPVKGWKGPELYLVWKRHAS